MIEEMRVTEGQLSDAIGVRMPIANNERKQDIATGGAKPSREKPTSPANDAGIVRPLATHEGQQHTIMMVPTV